MFRNQVLGSLSVLLIAVCACVAVAADPPDSRVNPATGHIETVQAVFQNGSKNIEHIDDPGPGTPTVTIIASSSNHEHRPRIEIDDDDDTWVTYWESTSTHRVMVRQYDYSTSTWETAIELSDSTEGGRHPEIVIHDGDPWIGYEFDDAGDLGIKMGRVGESGDPILFLVGTSSFAGIDVQPNAESNTLWVTWVDSADEVAWSEYDDATETWSPVQWESYAPDSVTLARKRIRTDVLN